jgi:hypothetical protein
MCDCGFDFEHPSDNKSQSQLSAPSLGGLAILGGALLARIIHEGADYGRHTKASAWYKAVATRAFSHDGGF